MDPDFKKILKAWSKNRLNARAKKRNGNSLSDNNYQLLTNTFC